MLPAAPEVCKFDSGAWYIPLTDLEFTFCQGPDSARFLQGQLSCNLQKLTPVHSLRGALCNLKGRVITDLRVLSDEKGILLLTQHEMREKMLGTLNKYRVFFKTTLTPVDTGFVAMGLGGPDLDAITTSLDLRLPENTDQMVEHSGLRIVALPRSHLSLSPRYLCVINTTDTFACTAMELFAEKLDRLPDNLWHLADIRDGELHIRPEYSEQFTPQLLNYDINGVIDFRKGCYTGQEIVARMYYKAEAKRRLYHFRAATTGARESAITGREADVLDEILLADGSTEGLIILNVSEALTAVNVTDLSKQQPDNS